MSTEEQTSVDIDLVEELRHRCVQLDLQNREWRHRAWAAERVRDEMTAAVRTLLHHSAIEPESIISHINSQT